MPLYKIKNTASLKRIELRLGLVILLVLAVMSAMFVWTPEVSHADTSGTIRVRVYSNAPSAQTPIAGASGQVFTILPCNGQPFTIQATTNASGIFTYSWPAGCGAGGMDSIFCTDPGLFSKAGYTIVNTVVDAGNSNTGANGTCGTIVGTGGTLSFTATMTPNPTLDFGANTASITKGSSAVLNWNAANATICNATSGGINISGGRTGSLLVEPSQTTTYTIKCDKSGTPSVTKSVTITVTSPPAASAPSTKKNTPAAKPPAAPAVVGTGEDKTPPTALKTLEATSGPGVISITWAKPADTEGVVKYLIERSKDGLEWEQLSDNHTTTSFDDNTVEEDTYYYYRVRAIDAGGNQSEAVTTEAVLAATVTNEKPKATPAPVKKVEGGAPVGIIIGGGIVGALVLAGGVAWWLRRRASLANNYNYDYATSTPAPQQPVNPTITPQQQPVQPPAGQAPHTSMSLKDMVMQDYHPDDPRNQPKPPGQQ